MHTRPTQDLLYHSGVKIMKRILHYLFVRIFGLFYVKHIPLFTLFVILFQSKYC